MVRFCFGGVHGVGCVMFSLGSAEVVVGCSCCVLFWQSIYISGAAGAKVEHS